MSDSSETVADISGASRGIGRLISVALAGDGAQVVGFARQSEDLDSLRTERGTIVPIATDVTSPESVRASFARVIDEVGHPTLLVTCAGSIDALGPIALVDPDRWWHSVAVDLRGTMLCVQAAASSMTQKGPGASSPCTATSATTEPGTCRRSLQRRRQLRDSPRPLPPNSTEPESWRCVYTQGFVHTPMTEHLASSADGLRWLPEFGELAPARWGDGRSAVDLIRLVIRGDADSWSRSVIHVGDTFVDPIDTNDERRRLRIDLGDD